MRGYNKVILIGNLVRDAEVRTGASGTKAVSFTLAVSRSYKDKSGVRKDETDFLRCVAFGSTGDVVSNYTSKGSRLAVEGELREEKYKSKSGENKTNWVIFVNNVVLLDKKESAPQAAQQATPQVEAEEEFSLDFDAPAPDAGQVTIPF